ncbi:MAG: hypothetical protein K9M07_03780 [Simkaniaceae bacterium]|nr:hypothetical protein [Simkaniaceae bacterium]
MIMRRFLSFFLFISFALFAEFSHPNIAFYTDYRAAFSINQNEASKPIHLNQQLQVALITGQLMEFREDLMTGGKQPIYLKSSYLSPLPSIGNLHGAFHLMPHLHIDQYLSHEKGLTPVFYIRFSDEYGRKFLFKSEKKGSLGYQYHFIPPIGLTNTFEGDPSGQTNPFNIRIKYDSDKHEIRVVMGDGTEKVYAQRHKLQDRLVYKGYRYDLIKETLKNGLTYLYQYDQHRRLCEIKSMNPGETKAYGGVWFHYFVADKDPRASDFKIITSQGKTHIYHMDCSTFPKSNLEYPLFQEISPAYDSKHRYIWKKHASGSALYPTMIDFLQGRFIQFHTFENPRQLGLNEALKDRLSSINVPYGKNNEPIELYRFSYTPFTPTPRGILTQFSTQVKETAGGLLKYEFNRDLSLTKIETYKQQQGSTHLDHSEHFCWENKNGMQYLSCIYTTKSQTKEGVLSSHFEYDENGNIIQETQFGSFSGLKSNKFKFNHAGFPIGEVEKRITTREYTHDGTNRLVKIVYPDGSFETFDYLNSTHLITRHFYHAPDKGVIKRQFYSYNKDHFLTCEVEDDGTSMELNDFSGVHLRKERDIIPTPQDPGLDLPHIILEKGIDPSSQEVTLIQKTILSYSPEGKVICKEIYDADDQLCYVLNFQYNDQGRLIYETDPLNREIKYTYDAYGNLIRTQHLQKQILSMMEYDQSNRLIKKTIQTPHGTRSVRYQYDNQSRKVSEKDERGREKRFTYDSQNNLISTLSPAYLTHQGYLVEPSSSTTYAPFHRILKTVENHLQTNHYTYNSLGNVIETTNVSGEKTRIVYSLAGETGCSPFDNAKSQHLQDIGNEQYQKDDPTQMCEKCALADIPDSVESIHLPNGHRIFYTRDALKRPIRIDTFSSNKELLTQKHYKYAGFLLLSETDEKGNEISYQYDSAGRVIQKMTPHSRTTYTYDARGRIARKTRYPSNNEKDAIHENFAYDNLNRLIEEKIESNGQMSSHIELTYDLYDHVIEKKVHTNDAPLIEKWSYDSWGQRLSHTDIYGQTTRYRYSHLPFFKGEKAITAIHKSKAIKRNARKIPDTIQVLQLEKIDAKQTVSCYCYNEADLLISFEKKDKNGLLLAQEEYGYDQYQRKVFQKNKAILNGKVIATYVTHWGYDKKGNITSYQSGQIEDIPQITKAQYGISNQIKSFTKRSGVSLLYQYNDSNQVSRLLSTNRTIDYSYEYDKKGHLISVFDHILQRQETYGYDAEGNLLSETLANGLKIQYTYDGIGRPMLITLPDHSQIAYHYHGSHLVSIERKNQKHLFQVYDQNGTCLKETLMYDLGSVTYQLNHYRNISKISHKLFTQTIDLVSPSGLPLKTTLSTPNDTFTTEFLYNANDQLVEEKGLFTNTYEFDSLGKIRKKNRKKTEISSYQNLLQIDDKTIEYDDNNNPKIIQTPRDTFHCIYDALDRLIEWRSNKEVIRYTYDSQNRLMTQATIKNGKEEQKLSFIYDHQTEIGSYCNASPYELKIIKPSSYQGLQTPVCIELEGKAYVPLPDLYGNIALLIDPKEVSCAEARLYSQQGESDLIPIKKEIRSTKNPYTYQSKRTHPLSILNH